MTARGFTRTSILLFAFAAVSLSAQQQSPPPVFRSSVELTSIDISVIDDRGRPIPNLKPEDFTVRVDGSERRVVNAEWISLQTAEKPPAPPAPPGYSGNENATGGRLILLVVDEPNIRAGGALAIRGAVNTFIDHLQPSDRAAIVGIGPGAPTTPFTADRGLLKRAVDRLAGQHQSVGMGQFSISVSEALQVQRHVPGVLEEVIVRECAGMAGPAFEACQIEVEQEVTEKAITGAADGQATISVLRSLLVALKAIDAPKTMILVSEGFITDDSRSAVIELGAIAAASRTSIFAMKLDDQLFAAATSEQHAPMSSMDDRYMRSEGLELLASASRGALFNVMGTGSEVFARVESELSGYYMLAVDSNPSDRDGRSHSVRVEVVNRKGVTIRSRRALMAQADTKPKTAREAVVAAVSTPLPISALPLRVATFSLQGPEAGRVQLLIHADIGTDYSAPRNATVGYTIANHDGRIIDSQVGEARLPPIMNGVPSALQFTAGASVPPGEYTLKLAVNEGDRIGSVEHEFRADVLDAGTVRLSDLMAGGPSDASDDLQQPSVGYTVVFGTLHGYVEAYGSGAGDLKARFELASSASGDALISQDVTPRTAGSARAIFSKTMPVRQLPPGKYVLRATISGPQGKVKSLTRDFEVASPAVLMTSAESRGVLSTADVYLPVPDTMFARGFNRGDLARGETLQLFRQRVTPSARAAFDTGTTALASGDFARAETSFKSALDTDSENTAVLAYLAAVFAAAGRDDQAAGAWQTALVDGSDVPQIYEWLADTLLRMRRLPEAQALLEEATSRWPADDRFTKPMAVVYATFGQGQRAVRLLARYIETHPNDADALQLGVEWIYHLRLSNTAAQSRAEDLTLARHYADEYAKTKGQQQALVKQWMEYLERN